ncbi:hypothetical protein P8452_65805 [Trifolium repens]|nr:hypothetical protein P8452_65805 [Trifolium repens]
MSTPHHTPIAHHHINTSTTAEPGPHKPPEPRQKHPHCRKTTSMALQPPPKPPPSRIPRTKQKMKIASDTAGTTKITGKTTTRTETNIQTPQH